MKIDADRAADVKPKSRRLVGIVVLLIGGVYFLSFGVLAYFGGYMPLEVYIWSPYYGPKDSFYNARTVDRVYYPLIWATRRFFRPTLDADSPNKPK